MPSNVFKTFFAGGVGAGPSQDAGVDPSSIAEKSVLDAVIDDTSSLSQRLGTEDRARHAQTSAGRSHRTCRRPRQGPADPHPDAAHRGEGAPPCYTRASHRRGETSARVDTAVSVVAIFVMVGVLSTT